MIEEDDDEKFWFCFPKAQSNTIAYYKRGRRWVRVMHSPPRVEVREPTHWSSADIEPTELVRILALAQKAWIKERDQLIQTLGVE